MSLPATLRGLLRPEAYPHPVAALQVVETHLSWVVLTGTIAYKIKRPIRYPFADFTDPVHRTELCAEELRLNRRFAPDLYLGVGTIREVDGQASLVGDGRPLESAVCMRQFDRNAEMDVLVESRRATAEEFATFGRELAAMHATFPALAPGDRFADPRQVEHTIRGNLAECLALSKGLGTRTALLALRGPLGRRLRDSRGRIRQRSDSGRFRECHGDLHLSNLVRIDARIVAFDALEFEPAFRWIDVADEVAFLCADLEGYGRADLATAFLDGYLEASGDYALVGVLDLYIAHRALVRAKVMSIRASSAAEPETQARWRKRHLDYVGVARCALARPPSQLVLMQGVSGSGKTWLASQLARELGAVHIRSDIERKRLAGLPPLARSGSEPGANLYAAPAGEKTYLRLADCAREVLCGQRTAICDATFLTRAQREVFKELARSLSVPLTLVRCTAPRAELALRLRAREEHGRDASEANEEVLAWQLEHAQPLDPSEDLRCVEADTTQPDVVTQVAALLRPAGQQAPCA